jgi:plasmid stability protein
MKKIVLRNLPPEIQLSIKRKALNEDLSREDAVVEILREAEIQCMVEHDVAIMSSKFEKEVEAV